MRPLFRECRKRNSIYLPWVYEWILGAYTYFNFLLPSYASGNGRIAFTFFLWAKKNIFLDSMAPDFCCMSCITSYVKAQVTLNDMEHKKRQHFLATLLLPFGSWRGTFWSFASKTTKQKLLIGCYRIFRGFQEQSVGKKITLSGMLRPSVRVCSLAYTTNQNKNTILCEVHIRREKNFISTKSR